MVSLDELKKDCFVFRTACQKLCDCGGLPNFPPFPNGWCGTTCRAFGAYLCKKYHDEDFYYICGWRNNTSHAWIKVNDIIIDITADQFYDCVDPIIVSFQNESSFHKTFRIYAPDVRKLFPEDKDYPEENKIYLKALEVLENK